jgi:hypothetical protein
MSSIFGRQIHHTVYQGGPLPPFGAPAYEYLLAGNGLFLRAESEHIAALCHIQKFEVRGLPALAQEIRPKHGRIKGELLWQIRKDMATYHNREMMYYVTLAGGRVRVHRPRQVGTGASVHYEDAIDYGRAILDLHSHASMKAFFSATDDADEQGFRWYGVIGRVYDRPEIALRLGVYGYHLRVPAATLFTGTFGTHGTLGIHDTFYPRPAHFMNDQDDEE